MNSRSVKNIIQTKLSYSYEKIFEGHLKYIDLQIILDGAEIMEVAQKTGSEKITEEYSENKERFKVQTEADAKILVKSIISGEEEKLSQIAEKSGIKIDMLKYFVWVSIKKAVGGIKEQLEKWLHDNNYNAGNCPVCGNNASTAFFKHTKRGRQRFLHCDHCGTEWAFKRIGCPYCDNIDQKKMSIKDSQDETDMRLDLCHKCMSYIKTYIGENDNSVGKEGWASIHLDILMEETGFSPKGSLIKPE